MHKFTDEELKSELERRKALDTQPPQPLAKPDFTSLISTVIDGVNRTVAEQYQDDDFKHYVYEEAMTAIYGSAYWDWRKKQKW